MIDPINSLMIDDDEVKPKTTVIFLRIEMKNELSFKQDVEAL